MGKFSDKFLDAFNLKNDDEYDEYDDEFIDEYDEEYDDYADDYDDYEEEPKKEGGLFGKKKDQRPAEEKQSVFSRVASSKSSPAPVRSIRNNNQEVCVFKPSSIEDSREITETLLDGKAVVINFEGLHVEISQRIIDFISGSCYALDGNLQKISNFIFIATPASVDISGDFQDLLNTDDASFDIAGFKSPLL
ncbi:MAG: cell division protein SepF [Parasporobacterium sp.]|nr:cell division protein SepF [Parasporobacterium sp.]